MGIVAGGLGALCVALLGAIHALRRHLAQTRAELAQAKQRLDAPKPPRVLEGRAERFGLLWFPQLNIDDGGKIVLSAAAGRPYCPRCLQALSLLPGPPEEWLCPGCSDRRAGTAADMQVIDGIVAQSVREFLVRNPGYRAAPGLPRVKSV